MGAGYVITIWGVLLIDNHISLGLTHLPENSYKM
jgi:hypothetical protein